MYNSYERIEPYVDLEFPGSLPLTVYRPQQHGIFQYVIQLSSPEQVKVVETIFSNVIDTPGPGFYWYILEVEFTPLDGDIEVVTYNIGAAGLETQAPRGLTAQVVKE